jgi:uncharacterized lipoprotein
MGRRADEYFAARSSMMSADWVDRLNRLPTYVVYASRPLVRTLMEHDRADVKFRTCQVRTEAEVRVRAEGQNPVITVGGDVKAFAFCHRLTAGAGE